MRKWGNRLLMTRKKARILRASRGVEVCRQRIENNVTEGRIPSEPTDALPGTPEKIAVMAARVKRGEKPNHPLDFKNGLS